MLNADISSIPRHELNQEPGDDGRMYYKIDFEIEMAIHSAKLEFTLVYQGKKYHTVDMEFL
jgi:hypothetical protein